MGAIGLLLLLSSPSPPPDVVEVLARRGDDPAAPFVFDPEHVEVAVGSSIRWVNGSRTFHTVTFSPITGERVSDGTFDASMFEEGAEIVRTFDEPGELRYFCQPHFQFMAGSVSVVERADHRVRRQIGIASLAFAAATSLLLISARAMKLGKRR